MMDQKLMRRIASSLEDMIRDSSELAKLGKPSSPYGRTELGGITSRDMLAGKISERARTVAYHIERYSPDKYSAHLTWGAYVSLIFGLTGVCIAELQPKSDQFL